MLWKITLHHPIDTNVIHKRVPQKRPAARVCAPLKTRRKLLWNSLMARIHDSILNIWLVNGVWYIQVHYPNPLNRRFFFEIFCKSMQVPKEMDPLRAFFIFFSLPLWKMGGIHGTLKRGMSLSLRDTILSLRRYRPISKGVPCFWGVKIYLHIGTIYIP